MMWFLLGIALLASGGGAQLDEVESCDKNQLNDCVDKVPQTQVGLPKNKEELDAHCLAYNIGMSCIDAWVKRCLPTDGQKLAQQQIGGARAIMRFLCSNETALRKDFLKEPNCWRRVSPDWAQCVDELSDDVRAVHDRAQQLQLTYFNKNAQLCCARDAFLLCVADAARVCSANGSSLLKRMAYVLAQDVAVCSPQPKAYCAASPPPVAAPLLIILYSTMSYLPRF